MLVIFNWLLTKNANSIYTNKSANNKNNCYELLFIFNILQILQGVSQYFTTTININVLSGWLRCNIHNIYM